ncbi:MAG TPA: hypothetical protein VE462_03815 [Propionibacteriaceae bacterium]|nr:hypothetical protein [Propionibacteriaceae bacterium]
MISFRASAEMSSGLVELSRLIVASTHCCGSGSSWPEVLSFFSPATVAFFATEPLATAPSTAGHPIR